MVNPRQIATLLGLCATSVGLYLAAYQAEDQPIVVWGPAATATVAQVAAEPTEPPPVAATTAPVKPGGLSGKPPAVKPVAVVAKPTAAVAPVATAAAPVQVAVKPAATVQVAAKPAAPATTPAKPQAPAKAGNSAAAKPAPAVPVKPAAKPVTLVVAPTSTPMVGGSRIAASSPQRIAAMAKQSAGRVDPFVSLAVSETELPPLPPGKPGPVVHVPAPTVGVIAHAPAPKVTPIPTPGDGMVVTGIITSAKESVAIVAADGRSRLVQVGDVLPGGIRVLSIHAEGKQVIVSHGGRSARLAVKE
jgi:hypothetical protein